MTSEDEMRLSFGQRVLTFVLAVLVLFSAVAALDTGLHRFAHGGAECNPDNATCVIALFGSGGVVSASTDLFLPLPSERLKSRIKSVDFVFVSEDFVGRANVRGPPGILISV